MIFCSYLSEERGHKYDLHNNYDNEECDYSHWDSWWGRKVDVLGSAVGTLTTTYRLVNGAKYKSLKTIWSVADYEAQILQNPQLILYWILGYFDIWGYFSDTSYKYPKEKQKIDGLRTLRQNLWRHEPSLGVMVKAAVMRWGLESGEEPLLSKTKS